MIGCTRLRAVSGILRTQRGRRGSGGAGQLAGTASAGPGQCGRPGPPPSSPTLPLASVAQVLRSPLWLKTHARPCGSSLTLATVAQVSRSPLWLYSGRRRAVPNCHWPWVSSRAARWRTATGWIADSTVYPLSPGRRRAVPNCHWSWVSAGLRAGVPDRRPVSPLSSSLGVQWGGLGPGLPYVDRRLHRVSRGPGDGRSWPSLVRG